MAHRNDQYYIFLNSRKQEFHKNILHNLIFSPQISGQAIQNMVAV